MLTRIVTFHVNPSQHQRIATILRLALERYVRPKPGFLGATIFAATDGKQVIDLAQWADAKSWLAMEQDDAVSKAVHEGFRLADRVELASYTQAHVIERFGF